MAPLRVGQQSVVSRFTDYQRPAAMNRSRGRPMALITRVRVAACCTVAVSPCGGGGGGGPAAPPPTVSLAASATDVRTDGPVTLTWSSTNASSCSASGAWSGSLATSGSKQELAWGELQVSVTG